MAKKFGQMARKKQFKIGLAPFLTGEPEIKLVYQPNSVVAVG
jgi:hypothetical protein